jgi:outer membrane receptor for ferrienterochelin and colicins
MQWRKKLAEAMKYGESIYTKRWELLGAYELTDEKMFSFSYTDHDQIQFTETYAFEAQQRIGFGQLTLGQKIK